MAGQAPADDQQSPEVVADQAADPGEEPSGPDAEPADNPDNKFQGVQAGHKFQG